MCQWFRSGIVRGLESWPYQYVADEFCAKKKRFQPESAEEIALKKSEKPWIFWRDSCEPCKLPHLQLNEMNLVGLFCISPQSTCRKGCDLLIGETVCIFSWLQSGLGVAFVSAQIGKTSTLARLRRCENELKFAPWQLFNLHRLIFWTSVALFARPLSFDCMTY